MYEVAMDLIYNLVYSGGIFNKTDKIQEDIIRKEEKEKIEKLNEEELHEQMKLFFTNKQLNIIMRKYRKEKLNDSEISWYSHTMKKRLLNLSDKKTYLAAKQILMENIQV